MADLASAIESGNMNVCCLKEENLYVAEHDGKNRLLRRCRVCNTRHYKMKAETLDLKVFLSGPNMTRRRQDGKRNYTMGARFK